MEKLIAWMEDNPDDLLGKQSRWHRDMKDEVFPNDEHITTKKINDKISNMKRQWKEAKALQENTGWGIREDEQSINQALERKCPFFHRLDAIWGSKPNVNIVTRMDSTSSQTLTSSIRGTAPPSQTPSRELSPNHSLQQSPTASDQMQQSPTTSHQNSPAQSARSSPEPFDSPASPALEEIDDDDIEQTPTPRFRKRSITQQTPVQQSAQQLYPLPRRAEKKSVMQSLKELMESHRTTEDAHIDKRLKMQSDVEIEKIKSTERILQLQAAERLKSEERIARIHADAQIKQMEVQADAQVKQMEVVAHMMQQVIHVLRPDSQIQPTF